MPVISTDETALHSRDGTPLFVRSARPGAPAATAGAAAWARVCMAPGYGDHGARYEHVLAYLAENGVAAHVVDFRGQGRAAGRRGFVRRWDEYLDDWETFLKWEAREWAESGPATPPRFLLAQSHGALIVVMSALRGRLPADAAGAVMTAPYLRLKMVPPPVKVRLARTADRLMPWLPVRTEVPEEWMTDDPEMRAADRADPYSLNIATPRWFLSTLTVQEEAMRRAPEFVLPLLILAGDADGLADSEAARDFCKAAGAEDKQFHWLPGQRHEPLREAGRAVVLARILDWLRARSTAAPGP